MLDTREIERWRRLTAAMLRHASVNDPAALAQVVAILDEAQAKLPMVAYALRAGVHPVGGPVRPGHSWADIGRELGITRSAACQRFGGKPLVSIDV